MGRSLSVVTVVYELEQRLLRLQARSAARYVDPGLVEEVVVIDNSWPRLSVDHRRRLLEDYGPLAPAVRFLTPADLGGPPPAAGYRSQQILKLAVAERLSSDRYVVLDAKNHWVAPLDRAWLEAPDGRIRASVHSYVTHPHRPGLEAVCRYLGLDPAEHLGRFTATVPPVTMDSAAVRELLAELGARSPGGFAAEFLAHDLSEFTLYTGWLLARGGRLEELFDVQERTWPVVWPAVADAGGVRAVVERAGSDVPLFAVHRKALTRMDPAAVDVLAGFWTRRELFADERAARRFVAEFRRAHRRRLRLHHLREAPRTLGPRVRRLLAR